MSAPNRSPFQRHQLFRQSLWDLAQADREAECAARQVCIDPERKELAEQARRITDNFLAEYRKRQFLRWLLEEDNEEPGTND